MPYSLIAISPFTIQTPSKLPSKGEHSLSFIESRDEVLIYFFMQHRSHRRPEKIHDINFKVRQVLNILFMVTAIVGCLMYTGVIGGEENEMKGAIVVIIAVLIKMAECMIRLLKKNNNEEDEEE